VVVAFDVPPDVVAAGIKELELEVVVRGLAADPEGELEILGQGDGQVLLHAAVAAAGDKIEIEAQGAAALRALLH